MPFVTGETAQPIAARAVDARVARADAVVHRSVLLLGGMKGVPVASMERYAEAMRDALPAFGWQTRLTRGVPIQVPGPRAARLLAFEFSRHVLYPLETRGRKADVYHVTDHSYGHLVRALPRERTVVTCHDLMPWLVPEIFSRRLGRVFGLPLWERSVRAMGQAAHVVCDSECTRRDVIDRIGVPEERVSVVPLGVAETFHMLPAAERRSGREALGFTQDQCVVLHVGHGQPYKNVEQVVRVVARLQAMGTPAVFAKLGAVTPEQQGLAAELGVDIRRFSNLSDAALNELYNAADVMLFPSRYEGFGLPPLEAMRAGLPVVVSNAPALLEITAGLAPHFALDNVDGMAEAIGRLWRERDGREDATAAARAHAEGFTWHRTAEKMSSIYESLLR